MAVKFLGGRSEAEQLRAQELSEGHWEQGGLDHYHMETCFLPRKIRPIDL